MSRTRHARGGVQGNPELEGRRWQRRFRRSHGLEPVRDLRRQGPESLEDLEPEPVFELEPGVCLCSWHAPR